MRTGAADTLRVGAGVAWSATVLPRVLREMRGVHPDLSIDLIAGVGDQLAQQFAEGKIDLLLVAGALSRQDMGDVRREHLVTLPMELVVSREHPLIGKEPISVAQVTTYDWVGFYDDCDFVQLAGLLAARHGVVPPRIAMRANAVAALGTFVRESDAAIDYLLTGF